MVVKINGQQVGQQVERARCASQAAVKNVPINSKGVRMATAAVAATSAAVFSTIPAHAASPAAVAVGGSGTGAFLLQNGMISFGGAALVVGVILWFVKRAWGKRVLTFTGVVVGTFFFAESIIALWALVCIHVNNWLSQAIEMARAAGAQ